MRELGLAVAGDEIHKIVARIGYLENGMINYSDFLLATLDAKNKFSDQVLYETFKHFDTTNKGYITRENLIFAFKMAGVTMDVEDMSNMFSCFDISPNTKIDFEQFKKIILDPGENNDTDTSVYKRRIDRLSSSIIHQGSHMDFNSATHTVAAHLAVLSPPKRKMSYASIS